MHYISISDTHVTGSSDPEHFIIDVQYITEINLVMCDSFFHNPFVHGDINPLPRNLPLPCPHLGSRMALATFDPKNGFGDL